MKQPVKRQRAMFAGVGGGNSVEAKVVQAQPELCHGRGEFNQDTKSQPREIGDIEVLITKKEAGITLDDFRMALKRVGMSQKDFSKFTRTPYDTVRSWAKGDGRIPGAAVSVLVMLGRDATLATTCRATGWEPLW